MRYLMLTLAMLFGCLSPDDPISLDTSEQHMMDDGIEQVEPGEQEGSLPPPKDAYDCLKIVYWGHEDCQPAHGCEDTISGYVDWDTCDPASQGLFVHVSGWTHANIKAEFTCEPDPAAWWCYGPDADPVEDAECFDWDRCWWVPGPGTTAIPCTVVPHLCH